MSDFSLDDLPPVEQEERPVEPPVPAILELPNAEQSLMGSCLVDASAVDVLGGDTRSLLTPRNRALATAMLALAKRDEDPTDIALLRGEIGAEDWDKIGGHAYIASLVSGSAKSQNVASYLAAIRWKKAKAEAAASLQSAAEAIIADDPGSVVRDLIDSANASMESRTKEAALEPLNLVEVLEAPPLDPPWVVPKWLSSGDKIIFAAQAGFGKSYILLDLALALATEQQFLGMQTRGGQQRVTIIDEENPAVQDTLRLQHLMRGREIDAEQAAGLQLRTIVGQTVRFHGDRLGALRKELDQHPTDWLFLDSLVRFTGGRDESSATDISEWFSEALDPLRREYGIGIIALHHIRKPPGGPPQNGGDPLHAVRGSGDIAAWPDGVWSGLKDSRNRTLQISKSRWGAGENILNVEMVEGDPPGTTRIKASAEAVDSDTYVKMKLGRAAAEGILRQDLIDGYQEEHGCSADTSKRVVTRVLAKLRRQGSLDEQTESRGAKRFFLAGKR